MGLFVYKNPKNPAQRQHNKETLRLAEAIKSKRVVAVQSRKFGLGKATKEKTSFYDWFQKMTDDKAGGSKSNHSIWISTFKHPQYLITQLPYPLISIQIDEGSEFTDEFEQICQALEIPVFVLPPKEPRYNGCVTRANGTTRYAFYPFYEGPLTLSAINQELDKYQYS